MSTVLQGVNRRRMARLVSEVLSPVVLIVAVILIVSVHSAGSVHGLLLGLVVIDAHTPVQVSVGAVVGAGVAAGVLVLVA